LPAAAALFACGSLCLAFAAGGLCPLSALMAFFSFFSSFCFFFLYFFSIHMMCLKKKKKTVGNCKADVVELREIMKEFETKWYEPCSEYIGAEETQLDGGAIKVTAKKQIDLLNKLPEVSNEGFNECESK
jgi:hypothetical protein